MIIVLELLSSIFLLILASTSKNAFTNQLSAFSKFSVLNECSDSYTMIDYETIDEQMNDSTRKVRSAYACAVFFFVISLGLMIYVAWGLERLKSEIMN